MCKNQLSECRRWLVAFSWLSSPRLQFSGDAKPDIKEHARMGKGGGGQGRVPKPALRDLVLGAMASVPATIHSVELTWKSR